MVNVIKILLFILVNAGGFEILPTMYVIAAKFDFLPQLPTDAMVQSFSFWFFKLGPWVWVASALASVGYFFTQGEMKTWFILAPLYIPFIYDVGVIVYFNFAPVY
jgi:hypothetical protein